MRIRLLISLVTAWAVSSCGPQQSTAVELSGYALVFQNRPIMLYTSAKKGSTIEVRLPDNKSSMDELEASKKEAHCISHLYKLKITGRMISKNSMEADSVKVVGLVDNVELGSFLSSVQSPVLTVISVCPTA